MNDSRYFGARQDGVMVRSGVWQIAVWVGFAFCSWHVTSTLYLSFLIWSSGGNSKINAYSCEDETRLCKVQGSVASLTQLNVLPTLPLLLLPSLVWRTWFWSWLISPILTFDVCSGMHKTLQISYWWLSKYRWSFLWFRFCKQTTCDVLLCSISLS